MKLGGEKPSSHIHACVFRLAVVEAYPSHSSAYFGVNPNFMVVIQDFSSVRFFKNRFTSLPVLIKAFDTN